MKQQVNLSPTTLRILLLRRIQLLYPLLQQLAHRHHSHGSDPPLYKPRQVDIRGVERCQGANDEFNVVGQFKLDQFILQVERD